LDTRVTVALDYGQADAAGKGARGAAEAFGDSLAREAETLVLENGVTGHPEDLGAKLHEIDQGLPIVFDGDMPELGDGFFRI
jgi:hypothetical protein